MSSELVAVIVGGAIGIIGGVTSTLLFRVVEYRRRARAIQAIVASEVTVIKEKAQRYIDDESTIEELRASKPMLTSIVSELGYLSRKQVIAYRKAVTLDMEMKMGDKAKALLAIDVCKEVLKSLPDEVRFTALRNQA